MGIQGMTGTDTAILLALIPVFVTLVKIVEYLIKKLLPSKGNTLSEKETERITGIENTLKTIQQKVEDKPSLTTDQNSMLKDLYDLHSKTDADGIPLHYFPRSFIESQKDIVDVLQEISNHQERTTYLLEALIKNLDKIENKIENIYRNKNE